MLVVLEEGAEAEVWEQYLSTAPGLLTTVVELVVGQNARLRFVSAQELDETAWVFGTQRARVGRDGKLDWVVLGFGSGNGKVFQNTMLDGRGRRGRRSPAPTRCAAASTWTSTRRRSTPPPTATRTSRSAASSTAAPARSGAG